MEATFIPLKIPLEMSVYAEKHDIFYLIQTMVRNLLIDKPADPIEYLIEMLKYQSVIAPKVILLGPPSSGKTTTATMLSEHLGAVHITATDILQQHTDLSRTAIQYKENNQEIPQDMWVKLIQQRLAKVDCMRLGWILEDIPKNHEEALCLQEAGIIPEHVVMLHAPDTIMMERSLGKWVDPVTADDTVTQSKSAEEPDELSQDIAAEDLMARQLRAYHMESHTLQRTYNRILKVINADQPPEEVYAQVLSFVLSRHRSSSPHTPRILLLGPPGAGKTLQANLIAQKYSIVDISCGELLKAVAADESSMGELIKPFLESGQRVPDHMVMQVLTDRLSKLDCTTRGWVLHGFPRDVEQAEKLQDSNFIPSRVFFLEVNDDAAVERLTLRAIDPVTGERYHKLYKPAPDGGVKLECNPRDSEAEVQRRLREYRSHAPALQKFYTQALHVNGCQDPYAVFEILESFVVSCLPKVPPERP